MFFVSDRIPNELRRIVEFLNEQMNPAEVLALEIRQHVSQGSNMKTLVARLIGQTAKAQVIKSGGARNGKRWTEDAFFESTTEVELAAIYVLPEMQGRGIGTHFLQAGIGRFPLSTSLVLRVERDNLRAQRLYEAHGFRHAGDHAVEFCGHVVHVTEMILHLPDSTPRTVPSRGRIWRK